MVPGEGIAVYPKKTWWERERIWLPFGCLGLFCRGKVTISEEVREKGQKQSQLGGGRAKPVDKYAASNIGICGPPGRVENIQTCLKLKPRPSQGHVVF